MTEEVLTEEEFFKKLARKIRVLSVFYLKERKGISGFEAHRIISSLPKEDLLKMAEEAENDLLNAFDKIFSPLENLSFIKDMMRNHPEKYKELMERVKKVDPDYHDYLLKLHKQ